MEKVNIKKLLISVITCLSAGIFGSIFTTTAVRDWYPTLAKPWFTPPNWVFSPVWITLYILMGISLYLVWEKGLQKNKDAIGIFGVQLFLNALWSYLFFGLQSPLYGLIGILVLWFAIALTMYYFFKISKKAGLLLVPYIVWVTIATFLNYYILLLN